MPPTLPGVRALLLALAFACVPDGGAQQPASSPGAPPAAPAASEPGREPPAADASAQPPLPGIPALMRDVEANQRKAEAIQKNYLYHSTETQRELDSHGNLKKTTVTESDHYWVEGVPVRRIVARDGRPLSPEEQAKENERVDKQAADARKRREKGDAQGKETDADGREEITVSRLLELGAFTNPRRVQLNGRPTIVVDYIGDPHAKTHTRAEDAIRQMAGTAWVDEQDHVLARVEGRFVNAYKIGGGLIADIKKDTRFTFQQVKVNGEVWLPARIDAQGSFRALLFVSFNGEFHVTDSNYRKFRATSTILPAAPDQPSEPVPGLKR